MSLALAARRSPSLGTVTPSLVTLACLAVTAAWQVTMPESSDESWLLDVGGRVLDGARFYVDFLEVNPPASILLYLPAVALARLLPISPIGAVRLLVLLEAAGSLALSWSILRRAGFARGLRADVALALATAVFVLLPLYTFGQREHIAVLAALPLLMCFAARSCERRPAMAAALLAGLGAGACLCIKPQFGLGLAGPAAYLLLRAGWRGAWRAGEGWAALAIAAFYAGGVAVLCPIFAAAVLPMAMAIYVPLRLPTLVLMTMPGLTIWLVLGAVTLLCRRWNARPSPVQTVLLLASAGFELAALVQGKGFGYHFYPGVALMLLAAALPLFEPEALPLRWRATLALTTLLAALSSVVVFTAHYEADYVAPGLSAAIAATAPHPRVMAITSEITLGHPTVEALGGRWVGRLSHTWASQGVYKLTGDLRAGGPLETYLQGERSVFTADLLNQRPDVVLVDGSRWLAWIDADPALRAAFAGYVRTGTYGPVMLWARRDLVR